jgi:hypothetical protein
MSQCPKCGSRFTNSVLRKCEIDVHEWHKPAEPQPSEVPNPVTSIRANFGTSHFAAAPEQSVSAEELRPDPAIWMQKHHPGVGYCSSTMLEFAEAYCEWERELAAHNAKCWEELRQQLSTLQLKLKATRDELLEEVRQDPAHTIYGLPLNIVSRCIREYKESARDQEIARLNSTKVNEPKEKACQK